jgi:hypothetical protein
MPNQMQNKVILPTSAAPKMPQARQTPGPFATAVMPQMTTVPAPVGYSAPQAMMADGGLLQEGGAVDEASGNEVPTGSLKEEVRDDIPAQLSEGEFVFPADVVRYIGLERLMQMRQAAKEGLAKMEDMGQMSNADEAIMEDDVDDSEFDSEIDDILREVESEEAYEMYVGGAVSRRKKFAEGGMVANDMAMKEQMEGGAMTTPTALSNTEIFRKEIETSPAKEQEVNVALEEVAGNQAVMLRENNSLFFISTVTPGIIKMNTFTADTPEMLAKSVAQTIPLLRASKVNGIEVVEDNPNIRSAFEQAGFEILPKEEGVFVVDITKKI